MKVLHVNALELHGGAARAVQRLHHALLDTGIDSHILVAEKVTDDPTVSSLSSYFQSLKMKLRIKLDQLPLRRYPKRQATLFTPNTLPSSSIIHHINAQNADVIHLHWIGFGMIRIEELANIQAPVIWTLHDNWAFTGGCHVMWECEKYRNSCGACPNLGSDDEDDLSRWVYTRKLQSYRNIHDLAVIAPSRWMHQCALKSSLLGDKKLLTLPNIIDTLQFSPLTMSDARATLGLPLHKKLILFGAIGATHDINKGFDKLHTVFSHMDSGAIDIEIIIFGSEKPEVAFSSKYPMRFMGHIGSDKALQKLYSAVDLLVSPSRQEAFGQIPCEAMACGTPAVAFDYSGLTDIIDHKKNGYLATPFSLRSLAEGIMWVLQHPDPVILSTDARNKITHSFSAAALLPKYQELYREHCHAD